MQDMSQAAADRRIDEIIAQGIEPRLQDISPSDYTNISLAVATQMIMRAFGTVAVLNEEMLDQYVHQVMDKVLELKNFVTSATFKREFVLPPFLDDDCECKAD